MSELATHLDRSGAPAADTRSAAVRYLTRTGNADVLDILGLADPPPKREPVKYVSCRRCRRRIRMAWDGVCQRPDCAEIGGVR